MKGYSFTGTREGMSNQQKQALMILLEDACSDEPGALPKVLRHGVCVGADAEFHCIARGVAGSKGDVYAYCIIGHLSNLTKYTDYLIKNDCDALTEPKPPLDRDNDIACADDTLALIAAPKNMNERDDPRSGTWATVRRARKAGKPVIILDR